MTTVFTNLANHPLPAVTKQKVRVVKAGWYGTDRKPVEVGQVLELPLSDAQGFRHFGKVEFVPRVS
jgi:hypothetical protein